MAQDQDNAVEPVQPPRRFLPEVACWQRMAYDPERRPPRHILESVQGYDRQLWLRWNRLLNRWELWRWRTMVVPHDETVPPEELVRRAGMMFALVSDTGPIPLDARLFRVIRAADWWRRCGSARQMIHEVNAREAKEEADERQQALDTFRAVADDNQNIIRRYFGKSIPFYLSKGAVNWW